MPGNVSRFQKTKARLRDLKKRYKKHGVLLAPPWHPLHVPKSPGRVSAVWKYVTRNAPRHPYHNINHIAEVLYDVRRLAARSGIKRSDPYFECLEAAALLHDIVYKPGSPNNERDSANLARKVLKEIKLKKSRFPVLGGKGRRKFSKQEIDLIANLILETIDPSNPGKSALGKILIDADLANLGKEDFWEHRKWAARELGMEPESRQYLHFLWGLFENHAFHTPAGQELFGAQWEKNRQALRARIRPLRKKG